MPICRDGRWHATQEEADACIKHPDDKDFDNLSTQSRNGARMKNASPSRRSSSSDAPSPAPPGPEPELASALSTASEQPENPPDNDIDQPAPPNMALPPVVPPTTAPTGERDTRQPVKDWLETVDSEAASVPQDDFRDSDDNTPPRPDDEGAGPRGAESPRDQPHTPPAQTGQGGEDATPPHVEKILKGIENGGRDGLGGGRDGDGTPTPRPTIVKLAPIEDYRPWYANWNARATVRASVAALICSILLSVIVLAGGNRDAERFP